MEEVGHYMIPCWTSAMSCLKDGFNALEPVMMDQVKNLEESVTFVGCRYIGRRFLGFWHVSDQSNVFRGPKLDSAYIVRVA